MQLDADLKMLLTKAEAQESLIKMQTSAENFEKQAGSLNARYSLFAIPNPELLAS